MPKPKLSKFDKALLELISGGVYKVEHLGVKLHVDPRELRKRLDELAASSLIVYDEDGALARLGIEGFNALPAKPKRRKAAKKKAETVVAQPVAGAKPVEPLAEIKPPVEATPVVPAMRVSPKTDEEKEGLPVASDAMDLAELLKQGAPKGRAAAAKVREPPLVRTEAKPLTQGGEEVCELCKAKFSLSVSGKGQHPKFGHCFCGAAYHKDCYESLISSTKKCVRCGKKLELYLDKRSEEAVKALRDVFD